MAIGAANPHAGSVHDAASHIQGLMEHGLGSEPEPTDEQSQEQERLEAEARPEEPINESDAVSAEDDDQPAKQEAEPEAENAEKDATGNVLEELPDTVKGVAEAIGLTDDVLMGHLQVPVKVNGETRLVNLKELAKGYSLEADYRHKTSDLADQRRAFEKQIADSQKEWQSRFDNLAVLTGQLSETITVEESRLDEILQEEGADAYLRAKAKIEQQKEIRSKAQAEQDKARRELQQQQAAAWEHWVKEQSEALKQTMPEFAHPQKAQILKDRIRDHLKADGYRDEEIASFFDHRHVLTAWKAMQYDELVKARPEVNNKLKGLPKVVKPGVRPSRGEVQAEKQDALVQRLRKTGDRRDAARLIAGLL